MRLSKPTPPSWWPSLSCCRCIKQHVSWDPQGSEVLGHQFYCVKPRMAATVLSTPTHIAPTVTVFCHVHGIEYQAWGDIPRTCYHHGLRFPRQGISNGQHLDHLGKVEGTAKYCPHQRLALAQQQPQHCIELPHKVCVCDAMHANMHRGSFCRQEKGKF